MPNNRSAEAIKMHWRDHTNGELAFMAIFTGILDIAIGAVVLAVLSYFNVNSKFWTPVILIYAVGMLGQQLTYSVGAINVQIQATSEYILGLLRTRA
jgi:hypothetical protein